MSNTALITLGSLRLQAQQRSDKENNPAISTSEWNDYLTTSYKRLYNLLVAAYGNDYYAASAYQFTVSQFVDLPSDFFKSLGVDLQYSGSPSGWVSLRSFEFIERNKFSAPLTSVNFSSATNLRYRLFGDKIQFNSVYAAGTGRIWYVPKPTPLQYTLSSVLTLSSAIITVSDASNLAVGMSVYATVGIPDGTTVSSIDTLTNQVTLSQAVTQSIPVATLQFWIDSTTIDGISGWEEYIILDAAIKANLKLEDPAEGLKVLRDEMKKEIEGIAEGRDAGEAHHVSDVLSLGGGDDDGFGGYGGGGMGGY